jgi:hypothetical protein
LIIVLEKNMQITIDNFKLIVTEKALHEAGVHAIPRARAIMLKQYCDKLTIRGACTGKCGQCALKIKAVAEWMTQHKAENPYGMFTYLTKNASAQKVEELAHARVTTPETNAFGEATGRDALDILMETFNG